MNLPILFDKKASAEKRAKKYPGASVSIWRGYYIIKKDGKVLYRNKKFV